jgi:Protein of unknown function (DUF4254)
VNDTFADLKGEDVVRFHDARLADAPHPMGGAAHFARGVWQAIEKNHRFNAQLWDEEDLARRRDVPDAEIAANKRNIDRFNQARNDAVEQLDEALAARVALPREPGARLHSETPGMMIDRLSILSLKIRAFGAQIAREDATAEHRAACAAKLHRLREQREDLRRCLDDLLAACARGTAWFKVYRQFKMYNDSSLNPHLAGKPGA